jgi:hypothetical protein
MQRSFLGSNCGTIGSTVLLRRSHRFAAATRTFDNVLRGTLGSGASDQREEMPMPARTKTRHFQRRTSQAGRALKLLQDEIDKRQSDLAKMIASGRQAGAGLLGGGPVRRGPGRLGGRNPQGCIPSGRKPRSAGTRVLASVPKVFRHTRGRDHAPWGALEGPRTDLSGVHCAGRRPGRISSASGERTLRGRLAMAAAPKRSAPRAPTSRKTEEAGGPEAHGGRLRRTAEALRDGVRSTVVAAPTLGASRRGRAGLSRRLASATPAVTGATVSVLANPTSA